MDFNKINFDERKKFYNTNESLESIIVGLTPKFGENILAICGSGDQAVELVKHGANVIAVEYCEKQLDFAIGKVDSRTDIDVDKIYFEFGSIYEYLDENKKNFDKFDSIYLSNALTFINYDLKAIGDIPYFDIKVEEFKLIDKVICDAMDNLKQGGKLYLTDGVKILDFLMNNSGKKKAVGESSDDLDSNSLTSQIYRNFPNQSCFDKFDIDFKKSKVAQTYYRKPGYIYSGFEPLILVKK